MFPIVRSRRALVSVGIGSCAAANSHAHFSCITRRRVRGRSEHYRAYYETIFGDGFDG